MQKYLRGANLEKLVLIGKKASVYEVRDLVRTSYTEDARMGSVNNGGEWRAQVSTVKMEGKSITISYTTISIYI